MDWKSDDEQSESVAMGDMPGFIVVWESGVKHLNPLERFTFLSLVCIISVFAIAGNILTLYVVFVRW